MESFRKVRVTDLPNKFLITYYDDNGSIVKDNTLVIDFNPIINFLEKPKQPYVLVHYQARPKFSRTWGIYARNMYYCVDNFTSNSSAISIKLDESQLILPPHAVMYYPNSEFRLNENQDAIGEIYAI